MITTIINPISRYFVTLDPVLNSYYEMAAPITFTGDFEIEVEFSKGPQVESYNVLIGQSDGTSSWITTRTNYVSVNILDTTISGSIPVLDGKLHLIKIIRVGSLVSLYVDGVSDGASNVLGTFTFDQIGSNVSGHFFDGIIANAKFTDKSGASDVITTFKLDNSPAAANYVYGGEEVVNGDFATDSDCTISNGKALLNGVTQGQQLWQTFSKAGTYEITFTVLDYVSGGVAPHFHNATFSGQSTVYSNGTYTQTITTTTPSRFAIRIGTAPAVLSRQRIN
jgi:hypothetical protein